MTGKLSSLLGLTSHLALQQSGEMVYQKIHLTVDSSAEGTAVPKYWTANKVIYHLLPLPGIGTKIKIQTYWLPRMSGANSKTNGGFKRFYLENIVYGFNYMIKNSSPL